jgi:hypothetical protein
MRHDSMSRCQAMSRRRCLTSRLVRHPRSERGMRAFSVVQVDNATPRILSLEKFVIRGIHGAVGLSRCTRR